jgi:LonB protease-like protein/Lon protease-like protein/AAA domain-containing protein
MQTGALTALSDLLKPAQWDRLSEADRTAALSAYPSLDVPAVSVTGARLDAEMATRLQRWVAGIVGRGFQPEVTAGVRAWLESQATDTHLFVGGRIAQGRTSLVLTLAREVMAKRPAPPEYFYGPDPDSFDTPLLLTLPSGGAQPFAEALVATLSACGEQWDKPTRQQAVSAAFDTFQSKAPGQAWDYISQLRAAVGQAAASDGDFPFGDDTPLQMVTRPQTTDGAPVVFASMLQDDLNESLLRANGGVLVLPALNIDVNALTTTLLNRSIKARDDAKQPVPLNVRLVMIGTEDGYRALLSASDDMARVFRREVWCNDTVSWTRETEAAYAALVDGATRRYDLPAFDPGAVARLIEEGARRSGGLNRSRLSTDLMLLHDLAVEAGELARTRGGASTIGGDITEALNRRRALQSATSRQVREAIMTGESMTPTSGSAVGQINGLGIFEWHPYEASFAVPMRISATVSPGRDERVLDIEQEAQQADADHVRGSMTMEGYLTDRYSDHRPLSVIIRIRFEQEHGAMGGDSASAAQLFTLLSALAQQPIKCSLAVTGAVGQYGEIQPIGGVNTKIDGFWEVCRMRYQQGERPESGYGVLIPAVNARDLMLRPEVAASIANEGWFHIWPVATVDEAIPLLMGIPAATVHQRVEQRLKRFHQMSRLR